MYTQKQTEEIFAQTLKSTKVPGIKSVAFKHLTFGDAPFRVESIHVSDKRSVSECVCVYVGVFVCSCPCPLSQRCCSQPLRRHDAFGNPSRQRLM